jgi:hypothetical protein
MSMQHLGFIKLGILNCLQLGLPFSGIAIGKVYRMQLRRTEKITERETSDFETVRTLLE